MPHTVVSLFAEHPPPRCVASLRKNPSALPQWQIAKASLSTTPFTCSAVMSLMGVKRTMMSLPTNNNHPASLLSSLSPGCLATPQLSPLRASPSCGPCSFVNHLLSLAIVMNPIRTSDPSLRDRQVSLCTRTRFLSMVNTEQKLQLSS